MVWRSICGPPLSTPLHHFPGVSCSSVMLSICTCQAGKRSLEVIGEQQAPFLCEPGVYVHGGGEWHSGAQTYKPHR